MGSIPAKGSSSKIKFGLEAIHLAISNLLLSPPDKDNDGDCLKCSIPKSESNLFNNFSFSILVLLDF